MNAARRNDDIERSMNRIALALFGLLIAPTVVAAEAVRAPTDLGGMATLGFAFCTFLGIVINGVLSLLARKDAREAKKSSAATTVKMETVEKAVDGQTKALIETNAAKVAAETQLRVLEDAKVREGADALAVQKAGLSATAPIATDASVTHALVEKENGSSAAAKASALITEAAIKAKTLLETAATTAANLVINAKSEAKAVEKTEDAKIEARKDENKT